MFPKEAMKKWVKAIHHVGFFPFKYSDVCIKHFDEKHIIKDKLRRADRSILQVPRKIPKLTIDAVPTIFPGRSIGGARISIRESLPPEDKGGQSPDEVQQ